MLQHARVSIASVALGVSLVFAHPSQAQRQYTVIELNGLPGSASDHASGVNDRGEVIGLSGPHAPVAVAWTRDGLVELGGLLPSEPDAVPRSINKRGDIVGDSLFSRSIWPFQRHGFVWRDGVMTDLGTLPGKTDSYAAAINDRGEIAGSSEAPDGTRHAVLWRDGAIVDLGLLPGSFNTVATSINDRGQVVGFALDLLNPGIHNRAFLWEDGQMIELPPMSGRAWAIASAINDHGEIVGFQADAIGYGDRAIMWIPKKGR
jgi:probable HAF family extracellular repeat protein